MLMTLHVPGFTRLGMSRNASKAALPGMLRLSHGPVKGCKPHLQCSTELCMFKLCPCLGLACNYRYVYVNWLQYPPVAKQAILLIFMYTKILYYHKCSHGYSSLHQQCKSAVTPTKQLKQSTVHLAFPSCSSC